MKNRIQKTHQRSLYKTFTWRIIASLDTAILAFLFSYYGDEIFLFFAQYGLLSSDFEITQTTVKESINDGLLVGSIEIVTKLIIYYFHERAWRINYKKQSDKFHHSKKRSMYKAITYRIIGSLKCSQGGHNLTNILLRKLFSDQKNYSLFEIKGKNLPHFFANKNQLKSIA